jgi:tryptophan synthase beta chain
MTGVEAGGDGIIPERHAARFQGGRLGVLQGTKTWLLANADGQIELTHSVSAGLDYAAIGPEHAWLARSRPRHLQLRHRQRGARRLPGTQPGRRHHPRPRKLPCHRRSLQKVAPTMRKDQIILVNLSGRGDKDVAQAARMIFGEELKF